MPKEIVSDLRSHGAEVNEADSFQDQIPDADVIYMTRIQKERFPDDDEYSKVAGIYKLRASDLSGAKKDMIVMHPLPRVDEIDSVWTRLTTPSTSSRHLMESQREWHYSVEV